LPADKTFDNDWLHAELNRRGAFAVIPPQSASKGPDRLRLRDVQKAPSDRKLLLQAQGIPQNCNALRQDRRKLQRGEPPRRISNRYPMNVHTPLVGEGFEADDHSDLLGRELADFGQSGDEGDHGDRADFWIGREDLDAAGMTGSASIRQRISTSRLAMAVSSARSRRLSRRSKQRSCSH
jgi:hypothetical protein